ncbi:MAG: RNA polymerase sigma factor [Eggerthellaceae bacterium]
MKNRLRDGEAFDRLVEEHYDDVLAYCRRHAPFYDDAPDVAQEAFLRFVRSGRSPLDGKPLAYLFTIARNLCIIARAGEVFRRALDVDVPDGSPDADPAMAIGDGEVVRWLTRSPELRDVVELRFDQGFKVGEIADVLGVSRFAVNRRLNRALAELRRGLEGRTKHERRGKAGRGAAAAGALPRRARRAGRDVEGGGLAAVRAAVASEQRSSASAEAAAGATVGGEAEP